LQSLTFSLSKKEISSENLIIINSDIQLINSFSGTEKELAKALKNTHSKILVFVEEQYKFVAKNNYRNIGMAMGIAFGAAFSSFLDNPGFGISIGMILGLIVGTYLDKNAKKDGKQLDYDINDKAKRKFKNNYLLFIT
jgi:hypothetical protein